MAIEAPCQAEEAGEIPTLEGADRALGGGTGGGNLAQSGFPGPGGRSFKGLRNSSIGKTKQGAMRPKAKQDQQAVDRPSLLPF
jgi:hypothetical protein